MFTMANIICSGCGNLIDGNEKYCPVCGKATAASAANTPPAPQAPPAATPYPPVYSPQPQYIPAPNYDGKSGKGLGWITFLKVMLWILFALMEITTLVYVVAAANYFRYHGALIGFLIFLGGTLISFLTLAGGMVALNNATNLRSIATNTAKTVGLLEEIKRKQ